MIPSTVGAVLMIGHFVVSIFGVPLGNPVIYTLPFADMEQCQFYAQQMPTQPVKIDLEWQHMTRTQCYTGAEFQKLMDERNAAASASAQPEVTQ